MKYTIFQSLSCGYREAKPSEKDNKIGVCPVCNTNIQSHEANLVGTSADSLKRTCRFEWKTKTEWQERNNDDDNNYYSENYNENGNYIGNQDSFNCL